MIGVLLTLKAFHLHGERRNLNLVRPFPLGYPARGQPIPTHTLNTDKSGRPALGNGDL